MGKKAITVKCGKCGKWVNATIDYFGFWGFSFAGTPEGEVACPFCGHLIHYCVPSE